MSEPLNTIPIQQFLQRVKIADSSQAKEVKLSIQEAKTLAFTLGIVMTRLNGDLEELIRSSNSLDDAEIHINLDGGSDWK